MNRSRPFVTAFWIVVLVLAHYTLRPFLGWRVQADFLIVALLLVAVRARPAVAAVCGLAIGAGTDALTPETFGAGALAMTLVGFGASWLKAAFFTENLALNAVFVFAGKWAFDVVYLVAQRRMHAADLLVQLVWWSPLSAGLTAAVGIGVLVWSGTDSVRRRA
ncbi:MAG TPA: rod shape-determining protein MreD [Gemmatimonadaceae bacterium]|nr:rod shape-determining protein MreD [Gemmatimonadaceae bacterium]